MVGALDGPFLEGATPSPGGDVGTGARTCFDPDRRERPSPDDRGPVAKAPPAPAGVALGEGERRWAALATGEAGAGLTP